MALPTLTLDDKPDDVLAEHVHTLTTLTADTRVAHLAPKFNALVTNWKSVRAQRIDLVIALAQAQAAAIFIDMQLNGIADLVYAALQTITDKDKTDPLWPIFMKGYELSELKRPVLQNQLAIMKQWPQAITDANREELILIGKKLAPLLPIATDAEGVIVKARQAIETFDKVGPWRQHVDQGNTERVTVYGELLEIPHNNPDARLPADYADQFFLHDTSRRGANKPKSSEEIAVEMGALKVKLVALEKDKVAAVEREAREDDQKRARAQKAEELAVLKQQEKETKARKKALETELRKKKK
jgi:hypothetical protein